MASLSAPSVWIRVFQINSAENGPADGSNPWKKSASIQERAMCVKWKGKFSYEK